MPYAVISIYTVHLCMFSEQSVKIITAITTERRKLWCWKLMTNEMVGIGNLTFSDILSLRQDKCSDSTKEQHLLMIIPANLFRSREIITIEISSVTSNVAAASTDVWLKSIALTCIPIIVTQFPLSLPAVARLPAQSHQLSGLCPVHWPYLGWW